MIKYTLVLAAVFFASTLSAQTIVAHLLCDNRVEPLGVDSKKPAFSWQLHGNRRNLLQTSYEIRVASDASMKSMVWSSGKIASNRSQFVPYGGNDLQPGNYYYWQVRVWDNNAKTSAWSPVARFLTGLQSAANWKAKWIEPGYPEDSVLRPSPVFRKPFSAPKKIRSAIAFITSHGIYEAFLNGKRVGDAHLTPGWTSYNKHLQYQVYDVTNLLQNGNNTIGVQLGSGWYRGNLAWDNNKNLYGRNLGLLFQLMIEYADGSSEMILSDGSWRSGTGRIRYSEIYNGEIADARLGDTEWSTNGFDDASWKPVVVKDLDKDHLIAAENEPIRKQELFPAKKIFRTPKGELVVDFGQNLVGMVQLRVQGKAGDSVKVYHAEVLDKEGNFYTENLRAAKQENIYVLKGNGVETFEPHFTFQGFRYAKLVNYPGELKESDIQAVAMYSDMKPTGRFTSSNALVNQLQHNIQWGQRGNFLDVPTDCPQRDERLGWTGDAQVFCRTAAFNMNVHNFFKKWLKDVSADQFDNGSVPFVVPNVLGPDAGGSAAWADAATIIPWQMFLAYGDTSILLQQYESMKKWVAYMKNNSTGFLWNKGFHFGDWLFYRPFDDNDGRSAVTDKYLISQCFFAYSTDILRRTAEVLGNKSEAQEYAELVNNIRQAFLKEYVTPSGRLVSGTQTAYVLALQFDMLPENLRRQAAERLAENVRSYDTHLTTGFVGASYLSHVLSRFGYTDLAYKLLLQETYPSWLYPVKMGATTIWERWDGQKPDGTFQTPGMNSFNHYAYGAIGDWMYRVMAGLETDESGPGYRKIRIRPQIGGNFTSVSADYESGYGLVHSGWTLENGQLHMNVEIPANTQATLYIPTSDVQSVTESKKPAVGAPGFTILDPVPGYLVVRVGSGKYSFTSNYQSK